MADAAPGPLDASLDLLSVAQRAAVLAEASNGSITNLVATNGTRIRADQQPGSDDWATWLILAGRGFGKTYAGSHWLNRMAGGHPGAALALIGATAADARAVMVEGPAGVLATAAPDNRPRFEPSRRRLVWPQGATARLFSAEEPDALRGPQFGFAWGDEAARWADAPATLANARLALRQGVRPRLLLTTTPRPLAWLKALIAEPQCLVTRGATFANAANLPASFIAAIVRDYGGTRLGRQEIDGDIVEDLAGALWTRAMFESCRVRTQPPLSRVVIGVDPPAGASAAADACGIVAAGLGSDGRFYVIGDASVQGLAPDGWARAVVGAADRHGADRVVVEVNNGGAMVTSVLQAIDSNLPIKPVHASRGKVARAEPVASLYAAGRVGHAGMFTALEDELCGLIAGGVYAGPGRSPDRADALVWALTELMTTRAAQPGVRVV